MTREQEKISQTKHLDQNKSSEMIQTKSSEKGSVRRKPNEQGQKNYLDRH